MATPQEVLEKALDVLQEKGWHQKALHGPNGEVCALGAMRDARIELFGPGRDDDNVVYNLAYARLTRAISPEDWRNVVSIPRWNDDPNRTAEDVILAFKTATTLEDD
jgi:hypothetical protein